MMSIHPFTTQRQAIRASHSAPGCLALFTGLISSFLMVTAVSCAKPATTLSFYSFSDGVATKIKQAIIQEFEKQNPDVKVKYVNLNGQPYIEKVVTLMASGSAIDVMWCGEETPYWGQLGLLRNLSPLMTRDKNFDAHDFYPNVMRAFRWKGDFYAFPKDFSTTVFYINRSLFAKAGVSIPKDGYTWDDLVAVGKRLTLDKTGDGKPDQWGVTMEWWDRFVYSYVWHAGGEVFSEDNTQCLLGTKESIRGIQFLADLMYVQKITPFQYDYMGGFTGEKSAMYQCGRWQVPNLRAGKKSLDWDVIPLPRDKQKATYLFLGGYGIAKSSKHLDESWRFVKFLTGTKAQQIRSSMGQSVPSRISVANSDFFLESNIRPKNAVAFIEQMDSAKSRPGTGRYSKALDIFWPAVWSVLSGKKSAAAVMPRAAADATKFLQR